MQEHQRAHGAVVQSQQQQRCRQAGQERSPTAVCTGRSGAAHSASAAPFGEPRASSA